MISTLLILVQGDDVEGDLSVGYWDDPNELDAFCLPDLMARDFTFPIRRVRKTHGKHVLNFIKLFTTGSPVACLDCI